MGEDAAGPSQEIRAVSGDRIAGRLLLGVNLPCLGQPVGGGVDTVHRIGQVDRGRTGGLQDLRYGIERDPVARRDPDQWRAADGQPADRLRDLGGRPQM
jgi:hypothetical protein